MKINWPAWLLGGALVASVGFHFRRDVGTAPPPARVVGAAELGLTPAQVERIAECSSGCCDLGADLQASIRAAVQSLESALASEPVDKDRARALAAELGRLRADAIRNCVESILLVRDVLEPEQLEALR